MFELLIESNVVLLISCSLVFIISLLGTFIEFKLKYGQKKLVNFSENEVRKKFLVCTGLGLLVVLVLHIIYIFINPFPNTSAMISVPRELSGGDTKFLFLLLFSIIGFIFYIMITMGERLRKKK